MTHGQLRRPNGLPDRRTPSVAPFDIAATLELNLDRFPSKHAMLALLESWLYAAEQNDLLNDRPGYLEALREAVEVMRIAPVPAEAVARLHALTHP